MIHTSITCYSLGSAHSERASRAGYGRISDGQLVRRAKDLNKQHGVED